MERRLKLTIIRALLLCGVAAQIALYIRARRSTWPKEQTLYVAAMAITFIGLCFKRVYSSQPFQWMLVPFAFLIVYIGAIIRQSSASSLFGALFLAVAAMCAVLWLQSRAK
jgi:hypothetical protein